MAKTELLKIKINCFVWDRINKAKNNLVLQNFTYRRLKNCDQMKILLIHLLHKIMLYQKYSFSHNPVSNLLLIVFQRLINYSISSNKRWPSNKHHPQISITSFGIHIETSTSL